MPAKPEKRPAAMLDSPADEFLVAVEPLAVWLASERAADMALPVRLTRSPGQARQAGDEFEVDQRQPGQRGRLAAPVEDLIPTGSSQGGRCSLGEDQGDQRPGFYD